MLIDPPDFVSLSPALIYDAEDLERETYKALLQLAGWMWVCKRHKKPLRTSIPELAERWGIKERATYARLQVLQQRNYINATYTQGTDVQIQLGPRALYRNHIQGEPGNNIPSESGNNMSGELVNDTPSESEHNSQGEPGDRNDIAARASCLHEPTPNESNSCKQLAPTNSNSVVVDPIPLSTGSQQQQTIISALTEGGVFPDVAAELALDPWITEQRIEHWINALRGNARIKSVGAVLAANLRAHWEPPQPRGEGDTRRYISGRYADYIEH